MNKDQLNQLVSSYQQTKDEKTLKIIMYEIGKMATYIKRRFKTPHMRFVDYRSVVNLAVLNSINTYNPKYNFANHFMTWLRSMVTREAINNPVGVRVPEYLAKKIHKMSEEAKQLLISGKAKDELMNIFDLTENEYLSISHYLTEVPKYLEQSTEPTNTDDPDLLMDVEAALNIMPDNYRNAAIMLYGLMGSKVYSVEETYKVTGVKPKKLSKYLLNNSALQNILEEYDV